MGRQTGTRSKRFAGVEALVDGRYRIRTQVISPKTGRRLEVDRIVEAESFPAAAAIRAAEIARVKSGGAARRRARVRLREHALSWLRSKLPGWAPSTRKTNADVLEDHLLPALGDVYLDAMDGSDLAAWRDGMPGKPVTVNTRLRIAKTMLNAGLRAGVIDRPFWLDVAPLAVSRRKAATEGASLTAAELGQLLAWVRKQRPQWWPLVATMGWTGLRFGDAFFRDLPINKD